MWIARRLGGKKKKTHHGKTSDHEYVSIGDAKSWKHEMLGRWLLKRPTRDELVELGILDREKSFKHAKKELEVFFVQRLHIVREHDDEAPYGTRTYPQAVVELLRNTLDLNELHARLEEAQEDVRVKRQRVDIELDAARQFVLNHVPKIVSTVEKANNLAERLCEDEALIKEVLEVVEPPLDRARTKIRKRQFLEATYNMLEKTDSLREEVFRSKLPWKLLEELPPLCRSLPLGPLRDTSFQRVRFLISPLRQQLTPKLLHALADEWPIDSGTALAPPEAEEYQQIMRCLGELLRLQKVHDVVTDVQEERWIFEILAEKIIELFRYHFRRQESNTCRMEKPEWAFRYMWQTLEDHASALTSWAEASTIEELKNINWGEGLATQLAGEIRDFLRDRWPLLMPPKSNDSSLFLHTIFYLLQLARDWAELYPRSWGILTAELELSGDVESKGLDHEDYEDDFADLLGTPKSSKASVHDYWLDEDWKALKTRLGGLVTSGHAWEPSIDEEHPCVYVQTAVDALQQCELRQNMLVKTESKERYLDKVIDGGMELAMDALLKRWNLMDDPLCNGLRDATMIIQGFTNLLKICCSRRIMRDIEQLLVRMIDKVVEEIMGKLSEDLTPTALGSIDSFFTRYLGQKWIQKLVQELRPETWENVGRVLLAATQQRVCNHLMNEVKFDLMDQVQFAVFNCRNDLMEVFPGVETKGFERLWEVLKVLSLPKEDALALRHDPVNFGLMSGALSTLDAMRVLHRRPDLK